MIKCYQKIIRYIIKLRSYNFLTNNMRPNTQRLLFPIDYQSFYYFKLDCK